MTDLTRKLGQLLEATSVREGDSTWFRIPLESYALDAFEKLKTSVLEVTGQLDDAGDPHVTVLYMGRNVKQSDMKAIGQEAWELTGMMLDKIELKADGVGWFKPTENSEWRTPVNLEWESPTLEKLNVQLLRRLVPYFDKAQFLEFKTHSCFGYKKEPLSTEQAKRLKATPTPALTWKPSKYELMRGDEVYRSFELDS